MSANTVDAAAQASPSDQPAVPQSQQQQQQSTQATQTQATSAPSPAAIQSPSVTAPPIGTNNNYQCLWTGCGEFCTNAESLYEHVCEKHVGRKSTNNLNLTCSWGNCHTTTVKRDHITSHIRVHVPLKPHKCDLCGKSFKRPQDLKKHVKTHAEDPGSMMRGPHDGAGANRQPQNGYGHMAPQGRMPGYPDAYGQMGGNPGVGYGYPGQAGGMGHYAPTAAHTAAPGPYGQVYYPAATGIGNHASFDKSAGFSSLDHLFGAIKNRQFDPSNYNEVSHHLMGLQGVIPQPMHGGNEFGGNGGGVYGPVSAAFHPHQNLPSFSNLRTKQDLTFIEDYLNQMTQTAYENSTVMPTGHGIQGGYMPRGTNSPPSMPLPTSSHSQDVSMTPGGNSPPALTPTSAMSYTSGHSPTSVHSHLSPTTAQPSYPTLPNVTDAPNAGMPASTLGNTYDQDLRRRWSGGNLQRAQPARRNSNEMEVDTPTDGTAAAASKSKNKPKKKHDANIDPALAGTGSGSSAASDRTVTPTREGPDQDDTWVDNMRILESIRAYINEVVKPQVLAKEVEQEGESSASSVQQAAPEAKMAEVKTEAAPAAEAEASKPEEQQEVSYPTLRTD